MNSFVVKAIILSAIVAYYGQCEGAQQRIMNGDGVSTYCDLETSTSEGVACCKGGVPFCVNRKTDKTFVQAQRICKRKSAELCTTGDLAGGIGGLCSTRDVWVNANDCGGHAASSNSRESIAAPMAVSTSTGAEDSGFDVVSAMIGFAVGAVLMLLTVYVVNVVRRKRKIAKSDEEAMVSEQTENKVQETPDNVVAVETVIETEME